MTVALSLLAERLRSVPALPQYAPPPQPVGYWHCVTNNELVVRLRFGRVSVEVGKTPHPSVAAIFSDCCQFWFAPWSRRNANKLKHYNFGPSHATVALRDVENFKPLLEGLEAELVRAGTIRPRAEKEAGLNAHATDTELQKLLERVTALERRMAAFDIKRGRPAHEPPAPITTFSPPGSMKHASGNYVHHESINPAIAKAVFKIQ